MLLDWKPLINLANTVRTQITAKLYKMQLHNMHNFLSKKMPIQTTTENYRN